MLIVNLILLKNCFPQTFEFNILYNSNTDLMFIVSLKSFKDINF